MTDTTAKPEPVAFAKPAAAAEDLSKEIEQAVERQPDERVKVVRLFGDCYRCNWWVQDATPHPFWIPSGTIRKSRFLRAAKTNDGLVVRD
jgi:hypothetical protein